MNEILMNVNQISVAHTAEHIFVGTLQKIIDELEGKILKQDPVKCDSLNFDHVALKNGNIYQETSN